MALSCASFPLGHSGGSRQVANAQHREIADRRTIRQPQVHVVSRVPEATSSSSTLCVLTDVSWTVQCIARTSMGVVEGARNIYFCRACIVMAGNKHVTKTIDSWDVHSALGPIVGTVPLQAQATSQVVSQWHVFLVSLVHNSFSSRQ